MKNPFVPILFIVFGLSTALGSIAMTRSGATAQDSSPQGQGARSGAPMWKRVAGVIAGVALIGWGVYLFFL
jgi:hypothetical protein